MDTFLQSLLHEITESPTTLQLLALAPRFVKQADTLAIPGAEKKAVVLKALHTLIGFLKEQGKVSEDVAREMSTFVDGVLSATIDLLIGVAKGDVDLRTGGAANAAAAAAVATDVAEATVEAITKKGRCSPGCLSGLRCLFAVMKGLQKKKTATTPAAPAAPAAADAAADVATDAPLPPTPNTTPVSEKEVVVEEKTQDVGVVVQKIAPLETVIEEQTTTNEAS